MGQVSVIAELERIGWTWSHASETEVKCKCPFHDDISASCAINTETALFKCYAAGCGIGGDFISFLARALKTQRFVIWTDLDKRYGLEQVKFIEPDVIERYHAMIWDAKAFLKELHDRGVIDDEIRRYRLGEDKGRITIPVKNASGNYVNVRKYLPGAPGSDKMRNTRGRGKMRVYPIEQMKYDSIVVCGGEIKSIVTARFTNPHKIGAVCATGGEDNWTPQFTEDFRGKQRAWVMMDVDDAGKKAAVKVATMIASVVPWVGIVTLPLDIDKYPKGDVNDLVGREKLDPWPIIEATEQWTPRAVFAETNDDEDPDDVVLSEALSSRRVGKRMRFTATVTACAEESFVIPRSIVANCDRSQDYCAACRVFGDRRDEYPVSAESPAILEMINVSSERLDSAIRNALGVPKKCGVVTFDVKAHHDADDVRVSPTLEISNRDTDRSMQPAVLINCRAELNGTYAMTGRMYPHPKTQQATLLVSRGAPTLDSLARYVPQNLERLTLFQPEAWTVDAITKKLDDIYSDFETNVTRIFLRRDAHLVMDLAYHSPLLLKVDNKPVKGWVETLVLGDSAQGKTEIANGLLRHYELGERFSCKDATPAGLIGGVQDLGSKWFVTWGVIPTHDKRLVVLEEIKGVKTDLIAKMTDMRSSGVAELIKIERRRTHARTRIIAISNARRDRPIREYSFGVEAVRELIGAPEDVRRFDVTMIMAASEIDEPTLSALVRNPPIVTHRFTSALCRELILWAWTRRDAQVEFDDDVLEYTSDIVSELCAKYVDAIPIIDRGSTRYKVLRLAAALACRTFSTCDDLEIALVRRCHVEYVKRLLERLYDTDAFGYKRFSESHHVTNQLVDWDMIHREIEALPFPAEVVEHLVHTDTFDMVDVQDWCGFDRVEAQRFLSLLVRKRAVRRDGRGYRKVPEFIEKLRSIELLARPKFIPEQQEKF